MTTITNAQIQQNNLVKLIDPKDTDAATSPKAFMNALVDYNGRRGYFVSAVSLNDNPCNEKGECKQQNVYQDDLSGIVSLNLVDVVSINPRYGPRSGGTWISVIGSGFSNSLDLTVRICALNKACTGINILGQYAGVSNVKFISVNEIQFLYQVDSSTNPNIAGFYIEVSLDGRVFTRKGTNFANTFTLYTNPTVFSVDPTRVVVNTSFTLDVFGCGIEKIEGIDIMCRVGTRIAPKPAVWVSAGQVKCEIPHHNIIGPQTVEISMNGGHDFTADGTEVTYVGSPTNMKLVQKNVQGIETVSSLEETVLDLIEIYVTDSAGTEIYLGDAVSNRNITVCEFDIDLGLCKSNTNMRQRGTDSSIDGYSVQMIRKPVDVDGITIEGYVGVFNITFIAPRSGQYNLRFQSDDLVPVDKTITMRIGPIRKLVITDLTAYNTGFSISLPQGATQPVITGTYLNFRARELNDYGCKTLSEDLNNFEYNSEQEQGIDCVSIDSIQVIGQDAGGNNIGATDTMVRSILINLQPLAPTPDRPWPNSPNLPFASALLPQIQGKPPSRNRTVNMNQGSVVVENMGLVKPRFGLYRLHFSTCIDFVEANCVSTIATHILMRVFNGPVAKLRLFFATMVNSQLEKDFNIVDFSRSANVTLDLPRLGVETQDGGNNFVVLDGKHIIVRFVKKIGGATTDITDTLKSQSTNLHQNSNYFYETTANGQVVFPEMWLERAKVPANNENHYVQFEMVDYPQVVPALLPVKISLGVPTTFGVEWANPANRDPIPSQDQTVIPDISVKVFDGGDNFMEGDTQNRPVEIRIAFDAPQNTYKYIPMTLKESQEFTDYENPIPTLPTLSCQDGTTNCLSSTTISGEAIFSGLVLTRPVQGKVNLIFTTSGLSPRALSVEIVPGEANGLVVLKRLGSPKQHPEEADITLFYNAVVAIVDISGNLKRSDGVQVQFDQLSYPCGVLLPQTNSSVKGIVRFSELRLKGKKQEQLGVRFRIDNNRYTNYDIELLPCPDITELPDDICTCSRWDPIPAAELTELPNFRIRVSIINLYRYYFIKIIVIIFYMIIIHFHYLIRPLN